MYFDEEGMVDFDENISFGHNSFDLVLFFDIFLFHGF